MRTPLIDRRAFLAGAGLLFTHSLSARGAEALAGADAVFASAYRAEDGGFGIATLTERGDIVHRYNLPARGHDIVRRPATHEMVAFARRPGTFAAVLSGAVKQPQHLIQAKSGRHFYGHGCFSPDGRLLYATENDFDGARGIIGIYAATDGYRRIGELNAYGVGPHDIVPIGARTLVVANGGIETHPDFPRAKLNIPVMKPNLAFIDASNGDLKALIELPTDRHKLSIRHLARQADGTVWFACQNEGDITQPVPLAGSVSNDGAVRMLDIPETVWASMRGYIGSIAFNAEANTVAITSPRGGVAHEIDPQSSRIVRSIAQNDICGVAPMKTSFHYSGQTTRHNLSWDNHATVLSG